MEGTSVRWQVGNPFLIDRAALSRQLPFMLHWVWPLPLALGAYFAPESPWNAVRRGQYAQARASLLRLRAHGDHEEQAVDNTMAYMVHVTRIEQAETAGAGYLECFKGTNARRTEIVSDGCAEGISRG